MESVVSYMERGKYGNSKYRGNCSGFVIKDLIKQFYKGSKPKNIIAIIKKAIASFLQKIVNKIKGSTNKSP